MTTAVTAAHMQKAEHYLQEAEDIRTAARFTGDRNAASATLAMIAQAHAMLVLAETLNDMREERRVLSVHTD